VKGDDASLADRLGEAADRFIAVIEPVSMERWHDIPAPGVWSIGKEAEHVVEAAGYHQWIVRLTIGESVSSRRPAIERQQLTTDLSPADAIALIRRRTEDGVHLLRGLTRQQLELPTRPPRAKGQRLGETIGRVLIGHYDAHRAEIEGKLAT
jgi:uncharacterized damage-inducible protein DinB